MNNQELIQLLKKEGIKSKKILDTLFKIDRKLFVPLGYEKEAYNNYPLPLAEGQTISQPWTVAFMLELLELKEGEKVLEIGTGSGWNAALISTLIGEKGQVFSLEIHKTLINFAKKNIQKFNLKNIKILKYDGSQGYPKEAPFSKIISTAACPQIPPPWTQQLKEEGILIAPVGRSVQTLMKIKKRKGKIIKQKFGCFSFVPLKGKFGFNKH